MSSLRIISYNVNGIQSPLNKGLMDWLKTNPADIICVQETKAQKENVDHKLFTDMGFPISGFWLRKGYSGVAVFSKIKPHQVEYGHGP